MFLEVYPRVVGVTMFKRCSKCGEDKPLEEFNRNKNNKDGRHAYCRACHRAASSAHGKEYSQKYPERVAERHRQYDEKNKERIAQYRHDKYLRETERIKARNKAWYDANRDRRLAQISKYKKTDRGQEVNRLSWHKRRAAETAPGAGISPSDIKQIQIGQTDKAGNVRCWWCKQPMDTWHIDHRIPLAKGGKHEPGNVCLACPKCNMSKQDKLPSEWAGRLL